MRSLLQSRTLSELPYMSDISESLLTGGLKGLRVETEAFSPGRIVASGVRGGPQSCAGSLLPSFGCSLLPSLAWTLTSAVAAAAALRAGGRLVSPVATRGWHAARAGIRKGFLPATDEGHELRFMLMAQAQRRWLWLSVDGSGSASNGSRVTRSEAPRSGRARYMHMLVWGGGKERTGVEANKQEHKKQQLSALLSARAWIS